MLEVLSNAVEQLTNTDFRDLSDDQLHAAVVSLQSDIDRLAATQSQALAAWHSRRLWAADNSKSAGHRLARETGCSISSGKGLIFRAKRLATMPLTVAAFLSGALSADRVDLLVGLNKANVADQFARDEQMLIDSIGLLLFPDALKVARYWASHADEASAKDRAQKHLADRSANASKTFEGCVDLRAWFDPIGGEVVLNEMERLEQQLFDEDWVEARARIGNDACADDLQRTNAQRRADAFVLMATRSSAMDAASTASRPLISVVVGEQKFAQICETAEGTVLTPESVVPLLGAANIERIIFDGPSRIIDISYKRRFTGALRRAIELRDQHCQDPSGCDVSASRCHGDHKDPWSHGHPTEQSDGQLLCAFHNRAKGADPPRAGAA